MEITLKLTTLRRIKNAAAISDAVLNCIVTVVCSIPHESCCWGSKEFNHVQHSIANRFRMTTLDPWYGLM